MMSAGIACVLSGCATQDELRQAGAQQGQAVQVLRAGVNRSESEIGALRSNLDRNEGNIDTLRSGLDRNDRAIVELRAGMDGNVRAIAEARAETRRLQQSVQGREVALTDARARADAAKAQADNALATTREFLSNLLASREEQRRQLDANGVAFAELRRKSAELESQLQLQQKLIDQRTAASTDAMRRLTAVEAGLQEAGNRATVLETRAKSGQEADNGLTRQIATLGKQLEETRSVISSEGLLQIRRELEDGRRTSASLRGSVDELQKAQADSVERSKKLYVDLDFRIQAMQKALSEFAAQDKANHLDLDSRIQDLTKAQAESATLDKNAYIYLDTRIQALKKAQEESAAHARNFHAELDARIRALRQSLAPAMPEGKSGDPASNADPGR